MYTYIRVCVCVCVCIISPLYQRIRQGKLSDVPTCIQQNYILYLDVLLTNNLMENGVCPTALKLFDLKSATHVDNEFSPEIVT